MNIWELNRGFGKVLTKRRHGKNDHQYFSWNLEGVSSMYADDWWRAEDSLKYQIQLIISCHAELCPDALGSIVCISFQFLPNEFHPSPLSFSPASSIPFHHIHDQDARLVPKCTKTHRSLGSFTENSRMPAAMAVPHRRWLSATLSNTGTKKYGLVLQMNLNFETKHMGCMCWLKTMTANWS